MRFKDWFHETWGFVPGTSINQTADITNNNLDVRSKWVSTDKPKRKNIKKAVFGFKGEKVVAPIDTRNHV